ncbi:MAG: type II toxin-antitoxin system VapC family toxin, partial [Deltaproteobacteria bacterium]|nr:type II toxin-antitoxin system VapC family toxin [Deltaproteobacteria bacterium]
MRFWDSSALVPLLPEEPSSSVARSLLRDDHAIVAWRLAGTEVVSALCRRRRAGEIDEQARLAAEAGLSSLERIWTTVEDAAPVDRRARRLLARHPLRVADALQLAAALVACDERPHVAFVRDGRRPAGRGGAARRVLGAVASRLAVARERSRCRARREPFRTRRSLPSLGPRPRTP